MSFKKTKKSLAAIFGLFITLACVGVVVAATLISGSFHISGQQVTAAASLTLNNDINNPSSKRVGQEQLYAWTVTTSDALTTSTVTVNVHNTAGMASGSVKNNAVGVTFDGTQFSMTLTLVDASHWAGTCAINSADKNPGEVLAGAYTNNEMQITYGVVGTFDLTVTVSGYYA